MSPKKSAALRESDLYAPVQAYLTEQGYTVRGEVLDCDLTAQREDELIVVELKKNFSIQLLMQATERQQSADAVYVAIPRPEKLGRSPRWRGMKRLLRRLELGLILVSFDPPRMDIALHPLPYDRKQQRAKKRAILREMADRSGDHNTGGSTRKKLVTAYREQALHIACALEALEEAAPRQLRALGASAKTTPILYANHYGWFERIGRGLYRLSPKGAQALNDYPDLVTHYRARIQEALEESSDS